MLCSAEDTLLVFAEIQSLVERVTQRAFCAIARSINDCAPVTRLPLELLCYVAEHLSEQGRIRATHVCVRWRLALLASASTWRRVNGSDVRPNALSAVVARSRGADLALVVHVHADNWTAVAACLESSMFRLSSLRLSLDFKLSDEASDRITDALCLPAPRLKSFQFHNPESDFNRVGRDVTLFGGHASKLGVVKIHANMPALHASASLRTVTQLLWCTTGPMHIDTFCDVLTLFPGLRSLAIYLDRWSGDEDPPDD